MIKPSEFSYLRALSEVENGNRVGWDESKGLWFPHESLEGGTPTIAYGHKLSQYEVNLDTFSGGISEQEAVSLFLDDYSQAREIAKKSWKKHYNLTPLDKYWYILVDIAFNVGSLESNGRWQWPKLVRNIINKNDQGVYQESIRWYTTPSGDKRPLARRSTIIARAAGLNFQP